MAELILTEEEKKLSFLDWDDASLGRAVKKCASILNSHSENEKIDADGQISVKLTGALAFIVGFFSEAQPFFKESPNDHICSTFDCVGLTQGEEFLGDWRVVVERIDLDKPKVEHQLEINFGEFDE